MDFYCDVGVILMKPRSEYMHFKSSTHTNICKHIKLTNENLDINRLDNGYYSYNIEHNKKFDYCLVKCVFKIVFNIYEYCPYIKPKLLDNKTMISWQSFFLKVIDDFENKGYKINYIAEMNITTIANKIDM